MRDEFIASRNNNKIKEAASYKDGKGDYFLVEGFHLVEMALATKAAIAVFSLKDYPCEVPHYYVNEAVLDKLTSTRCPEGIVALCKKNKEKPISSKRVLLLDAVSDPGNIGTLCRSALAFGFFDVVFGLGSSSPFNGKALMASQGSVFGVNLIKSKDLKENIISLKKEGYSVLGTSLGRSVPLSEAKVGSEDKIALILGNEGKGVKEELLALTSSNIRIEMAHIDSLNVAMAGSILMYHYRHL